MLLYLNVFPRPLHFGKLFSTSFITFVLVDIITFLHIYNESFILLHIDFFHHFKGLFSITSTRKIKIENLQRKI